MSYDLFFGQPDYSYSGESWADFSGSAFYGYYYDTLLPPYTEPRTPQQESTIIQEAINRGVEEAGQLIGQLIGQPVTGDFSKYLREVYPYVKAKAAQTGMAVDVYWFGDVVRCNPDGKWGVTYHAASLPTANTYWDELGHTDHFYVLRCPSGSEDIPAGTCTFQEYGSGVSKLFGSVSGGGAGKSGYGTALALGAVGLFGWFYMKK